MDKRQPQIVVTIQSTGGIPWHKLRVGILGLRRGYSHLRNFLAVEDATVIGCADQVEKWRNRAAEIVDPKKTKLVCEFEELLELEPDAVVIASNGRCQAAHAIQAMAAGCHVMSEVPGAFTHEEINHIILHAERYQRQYMLAENSCFLDFLRYWRKWILEDRFGPISIAEAEYLHYLPTSMVDERARPVLAHRVARAETCRACAPCGVPTSPRSST